MDSRKTRDRLLAARRFDPAAHVPLLCADKPVGWLRHAAARRLLACTEVFERDGTGVRVAQSLDTPAARTAGVGGVIDELYREGAVTGWRDERYDRPRHARQPRRRRHVG
jgi:hypothetical protein